MSDPSTIACSGVILSNLLQLYDNDLISESSILKHMRNRVAIRLPKRM